LLHDYPPLLLLVGEAARRSLLGVKSVEQAMDRVKLKRSLLRRVGDTLLARDCVLCGVASDGGLVCAGCAAELPRLGDACPRCAEPSPGAAVCGTCLAAPPPFDATLAAWRYEFPIDRLVQALKYGGRLAIAESFGEALAARVFGARIDAIIPMPLFPSRLRERGFNQAVEIGRHVARRTGIPVASQLVERVRDTVPQTDLPHGARAGNMRGAFACVGVVAGMKLAAIDDVMTTGASLAELARTLKRAGAVRVENWIVARTWPSGESVAERIS
jgi:ComF family protein